MDKIIVWALFDSGNGSYKKAAQKYENIEIYSIGLDIENKNNHFINLNLADYSFLFGKSVMYQELDKLPKPNLIIASPPCESWSVASAMKGGNASWKQDKIENLFGTMEGSRFVVRSYDDYKDVQFKPEKSLVNRINGELTVFNTIQIIKRYNPNYYIIENPAHGRIWEYIDEVLGFKILHENLTYYSNYGFDVMKPTKFGSNIHIGLNNNRTKGTIKFNETSGYNERSNIPIPLIDEIYKKIIKNMELLKNYG